MKKVLLAILSVVIVSSLNVWASTYQNGYQYKNIETKGDYAIYQVVKDSISTGYRDNPFVRRINTNTQETVGTEIQVESGTLRYSINQETKEATVLGFKNDVSETTLVIPAKVVYEDVDYNVTKIGEASFFHTAVEDVTFPMTLEEICVDAFASTKLRKVVIPDNVKKIGWFSFSNISELVEVNIGSGLEDLDPYAFNYCENIKDFKISANNERYKVENGFVMQLDEASIIMLVDQSVQRIVLPISARKIHKIKSFKLMTVECNDELEEIDEYAFEDCVRLEEIKLPANLKQIGRNAFFSTEIKDIVLPDGVDTHYYLGTESLQSILLGENLLTLEDNLTGYKQLSKIQVSDKNKNYSAHGGILYDKYGVALKAVPRKISNPELLSTMNFVGFTALAYSEMETLRLPESLWGIGRTAFGGADKLNKIILSPFTRYFHSSRTIIGGIFSAFTGSSVKEIYLGSDIAYPIDEDLFSPDQDLTLHVPLKAVDNFKQTKGWNKISNIIGDMDSPETKVFDFDYCNGYEDYRIVTQLQGGPSRQSGILITKEELKPYIGMKIRSVQFCQHWGMDMYVFVEDGLSGKRLAFQRGTGNHGEWSSISFDEPYVISGNQDIMVGFGSETDGYGIEYSETEYSTRNRMRETGGNWVQDNDSPGAYKIICSIEGSKIPVDIRVREVAYDEMNDGNSVHVKGVLENLGPDVANVVELDCIVTPLSGDGQPFSSVIKLDNLAIGHKQREMFETDIDFSGYDQSVLQTYTRSGDIPYGKYRIELKVRTVNGLPDEYDNNDLSELYVEFVPKPKFERRVVMEASLATWCGYSALGKEVISVLSKEMPDKFIGIAVHYNDAFTPVVGYGNFVGMTGSVPGSLVNRDMSVYPHIADIRKAVNKYVYSAVADVRSDAHFADEACSIIDVNADVMLSKEAKDNYRIAYVLMEDKVGPEYQNSRYTLPEIGLQLGGGEIYHDGIARSITEFNGLPETELTGNGREMEFKKTIRLEVPLSVSQKENLRLVAMLINQESGIIENAFSSSIAPYVKIPVKQIIISPENFVASEGDRVKLECKVIPENATIKDIEFHSTNPEVATVDNEGNVNVLSDGFCEIVVSAADGWGARSRCMINPVSSVSEIYIYGESEYPDVYNMQGILVCSKADPDMLRRLSKGIYVLRYSDKTVKMMR